MGRPRLNLAGMRSGRLTVIAPALGPSGAGYYVLWDCLCDCGNRVVKRSTNIKKGLSTSCGCLTREKTSARNKTHGMSGSGTYSSWHNMKHRCSDPDHPSWANYGGRGIKVCDRWLESIDNFIADMGLKPKGAKDLERIDNNKGYSPDNCRWATRKENMNNTRANRLVEHNGKSLTISQWADVTGIAQRTLHHRLVLGWTAAKALSIPVNPIPRNNDKA